MKHVIEMIMSLWSLLFSEPFVILVSWI